MARVFQYMVLMTAALIGFNSILALDLRLSFYLWAWPVWWCGSPPSTSSKTPSPVLLTQ